MTTKANVPDLVGLSKLLTNRTGYTQAQLKAHVLSHDIYSADPETWELTPLTQEEFLSHGQEKEETKKTTSS